MRAAIGVTGQFAAVDELLTGQENLQLMVDLNRATSRDGKRIVTEMLERFDLVESAQKPVSTYSGGMRRKLDLAMTLVGNPRIIFLDEPTTGLDPRSRRTMWSIIRELVADGVTIFLTTQYLEEADQLADRIAVLDQGRLVAQGTPDELKRQIPGTHAFNVGVDYIDYATPGLMLLAVCYGLGAIATSVNSDMTKGIINRFKVMDVSRGAVLTGHVVASVLTNLVAIAALIGVAFLLGFSPSASFLDWLSVVGIVVLLGFAAGWLTVALGLAAKSPETAGLSAVPLIMLPFFSSAIVPAEKMGPGVRQFAEYQPSRRSSKPCVGSTTAHRPPAM